jgi:hypothetical protein
MRGPFWNRLAAATGIAFALLIGVGAAILESEDIPFFGEVAEAGDNVFGVVSLLFGLGAVAFWWFTGTFAARLRRLEAGSGRLAAIVNGSGAFLAGGLTLAVGAVFAARNYGATDLQGLASGLLDGPTLLFPAAAYIGAAGMVGVRTPSLPAYSAWVSRLSVPLAAAYLVGAALQIFEYYAWINDTAYIVFIVWVLIVSIIGIVRWGDMDGEVEEEVVVPRRRARGEVHLDEVEEEDEDVEEEDDLFVAPQRSRPARKTASRKSVPPRKR